MKAGYLLTTVVLHLASLQGVKEHKCGICGREFTLLANMKRHVLIHTNIRAYQCHLCYKSFVQKQTLKAHMIVHSDVKPFKCKVGRGPWESAERGDSEGCANAQRGRVSREPHIPFHQSRSMANPRLICCSFSLSTTPLLTPTLSWALLVSLWNQFLGVEAPVEEGLRVEGPLGE